MVERQKNAPRGPGVGELEGNKAVVQRDGSVDVYLDPRNPGRATRLQHGQQVQATPGGDYYVWDGQQRTFHNLASLPNLAKKDPTKERLDRLLATPPAGTVGGYQFWIDEDGSAQVNTSTDVAKPSLDRIAHGHTITFRDPAGTDQMLYWDMEQKHFLDHSPVKEKVKTSRPLTGAPEVTAAQAALRTALPYLEGQGIRTELLRQRIDDLKSEEDIEAIKREIDAYSNIDPLDRA